jgi:hypothetical protein
MVTASHKQAVFLIFCGTIGPARQAAILAPSPRLVFFQYKPRTVSGARDQGSGVRAYGISNLKGYLTDNP